MATVENPDMVADTIPSSTTVSRSIRIDRLTGATNYRPWQIRMKMYRPRLHLWAYIDGSKAKPDKTDPEIQAWQDKDFEAQSEIQFHAADSLMYLISNQETTKEMWECLSEQYEKTDTIHQLTTFHMQEGDDFETFLQSWHSLLEQGTTAGLGFTDKQHVVMLLAALPSTWRPFVTTQSYQTQSLAVLINKMCQEYAFTKLTNNNLNQPTIPISMASAIPMSNQQQQQPHRFNKPINDNHQNQRTSLCNYCNKPGH